MNKQEMFNNAYNGVIANGHSFSTVNGCQYRKSGKADSTVRCGIGHNIPDELYHPMMEGRGVVKLLNMYPQLVPHMNLDREFLMDLQKAHDESAARRINGYKHGSIEAFKQYMGVLAERYGLTIPQ